MKHAKNLFIGLALAVAGCGHGTVKMDAPPPAKEGEFSLRLNWIKDKGTKYDLDLGVTNKTNQSVLFYLDELHCYRGDVQGELKHTFFNTGHRTFKYHPGGMGEYKMVCDGLIKGAKGDFRVELGRVLANPNGDGVTPGEKIAGPVSTSQKAP